MFYDVRYNKLWYQCLAKTEDLAFFEEEKQMMGEQGQINYAAKISLHNHRYLMYA